MLWPSGFFFKGMEGWLYTWEPNNAIRHTDRIKEKAEGHLHTHRRPLCQDLTSHFLKLPWKIKIRGNLSLYGASTTKISDPRLLRPNWISILPPLRCRGCHRRRREKNIRTSKWGEGLWRAGCLRAWYSTAIMKSTINVIVACTVPAQEHICQLSSMELRRA